MAPTHCLVEDHLYIRKARFEEGKMAFSRSNVAVVTFCDKSYAANAAPGIVYVVVMQGVMFLFFSNYSWSSYYFLILVENVLFSSCWSQLVY